MDAREAHDRQVRDVRASLQLAATPEDRHGSYARRVAAAPPCGECRGSGITPFGGTRCPTCRGRGR